MKNGKFGRHRGERSARRHSFSWVRSTTTTPLISSPVLQPQESLPPSLDFSRILIVGAGGFGREVIAWARDAWPEHSGKIAGFLSRESRTTSPGLSGLEYLGDPEDFTPAPDDALLHAIGIPLVRRCVAERLLQKGGRFLTLIHPTATVADSAAIGLGSVICPNCIVSADAVVGRFTLMNYYSSIAHDACTGDFSVLSPYASLGGSARIGDDVFLGMHATVGPSRNVGSRTKISAQSCALSDVPVDSIVYGVPGRIAPRVSL